jgi:general secretion pathway protein F
LDSTVPLTADDAVELVGCLAALSRSGLPIAPGLRAAAGDARGGRLPVVLTALAARLESGGSLEDGLSTLGRGLPAHVRRLMIAGARAGRLSGTLDELLAHGRLMDDMGQRLWQALAYPAALLAFLAAWLLFVALWLVPQMEHSVLSENLYELYDATPPPGFSQTEGFDRRIGEFARIGPPLAMAAVGGVLLTLAAARLLGGGAMVSRLLSYVPLVGPARWYRSLVDFSGLLAVFLRQQLPLDESLQLTASAARDPAARAAAADTARGISTGRDLAPCLGEQLFFPPTMVHLVDWGRRHAALADSLETSARMYRDRFELQLRLIRMVLPPMVFVVVAASAILISFGWLNSLASALLLLDFI